ncbi:MAG: hypothetical protein AMXMBFR33_09030 [Candidatus Xenobia bacterium]
MAEEVTTTPPEAPPQIEQGAYEILRARLVEQAKVLKNRVEELNSKRVALFGGMEMAVVGNEKIRTEQNCLPRDIVSVGNQLLVGYEVQYGRKAETPLPDVLSLYDFVRTEEGGYDFVPVAPDAPGSMLNHPLLERDFKELFKYYKNARMLHVRQILGKVLAVFVIGSQITDVRVLRWKVSPDGKAEYVDNRGEQDNTFPHSHDFEWTVTSREQHVTGRHPHVNILDEVFVETVGGDLTVKIENNTEDGQGIYSEKVDDPNQALQDAQILYAKVGVLILLKILPYREQVWRYLVFNTRTKEVHRIDAIGQACVQLPEDHGIVFPGGFYLQEGTLRTFEGSFDGMILEKAIRSPNGEDVLYSFHHLDKGHTALMSYNLIRKEVAPPIHCHGYCLYPDGLLVVFRMANEEPARVHPMQIWRTPFLRDDVAASAVSKTGSYLEKIGNADLVRGISDCLSIARRVNEQRPSYTVYEDLIASVARCEDFYHWLGHEESGNVLALLKEIGKTGKLVLEEFDKVETLRRQALKALREAQQTMLDLVKSLRPEDWTSVDSYVEALGSLRRQRGHLITLKEMRYADLAELNRLEQEAIGYYDQISARAVQFLLGEQAFAPYVKRVEELGSGLEKVAKVTELVPLVEELEKIGSGLELLTEVLGSIKIEDATVRTQILERIAEVLGQVNRVRALMASRRKELGEKESVAEFGVQFQLFGQSVTSAINLADSPEKCDQALSRLMLQLEELEARFGEYEQFMGELTTKREDVYKTLSTKRQQLLDQRQRRAQQLIGAADRILEGIVRRSGTMTSPDDLNTYFASDPMVMKVRDIEEKLRELGDPVKADELASRLKMARQESTRTLRDKTEIYEEGANVIRLGRHKFSVNTEAVELTMVPREGVMHLHITGTDFYQSLHDSDFESTREFWEQQLVSETEQVYRGEYLAFSILSQAEKGSMSKLYDTLRSGATRPDGDVHPGLLELVRGVAAERYDEGYERGIHDHDAALILESLLYLYSSAGLLRFSPAARAAGVYFWSNQAAEGEHWHRQAQSLALMRKMFGPSEAEEKLARELGERIGELCVLHKLELSPQEAEQAGSYLLLELARPQPRFILSGDAAALRDAFIKALEGQRLYTALSEQLVALQADPARRYELALSWVRAFVGRLKEAGRAEHVQEEMAVLLLTPGLERETVSAATTATVQGLLGQHARIQNRVMQLRLDEFLTRLGGFRSQRVPGFRAYQEKRLGVLARERARLRMDEYTPKVMSAFVRNKLINDVYLPLIGENLAKQIGSLGETKRTDLMGMLLLISPPGYGKTTLMEYIANRLGLIFVKVNGPALGHAVSSLDPNEAPNVTARQEVEKVNFGLEMGNNVLLYIDDIQHTNPEFLQKFISLCDAQRKIEGVWLGRTRTYDLRGKRFCVCMAGNPYTESGARFQIPDMLANRADTYNLGDVLSGREELFELSYLENALTSNPVLAPLSGREPEDVYKLVRMAQGEMIPPSELSHSYSPVELEELRSVLTKLLKIQAVLLRINKQYILSASMDDAYRTEPAFKLQGSYRNMNKLAEKVSSVMNEDELERLVDDHYQGESQTLTTGAEQNLLKLAELRGRQSPEQLARWDEIKRGYQRRQMTGGKDDDPAVRISNLLSVLAEKLGDISQSIEYASEKPAPVSGLLEKLAEQRPAQVDMGPVLEKLGQSLNRLASSAPPAAAAAPAAPVDLSPVLDKMSEALARLAERPAASAPVAGVASSQPVVLAPEVVPQLNLGPGALDSFVRVVPQLKALAQLVRGPKSKALVMDPVLVRVFDGLMAATNLTECVEALSPLEEPPPEVAASKAKTPRKSPE